jgi:hypothetical protein
MRRPLTIHSGSLTRRSALRIVALALVMPSVSALAQTPAILVHKDPDCGCCTGWVRHLRDAGFAVTVEETADLEVVRKRLGVPADLAACHTAEIAGYVIEGHVPAGVTQIVERAAGCCRTGRSRHACRIAGNGRWSTAAVRRRSLRSDWPTTLHELCRCGKCRLRFLQPRNKPPQTKRAPVPGQADDRRPRVTNSDVAHRQPRTAAVGDTRSRRVQ